MGNANILPSNRCVLAGAIDPDANAAGTLETGWVSMATYQSILALVAVGDLGTSATVDAKLEQATDSSGTGAKDITGKSITQLTDAGSDSDKQAVINCRGDELDVAGGFDHVRLSLTTAVATSDSAGFIFGLDARYQPAAAAATLDEVVS